MSLPGFVIPATVSAALLSLLASGDAPVRVEVGLDYVHVDDLSPAPWAFRFTRTQASFATLRRMYSIVEPAAPRFDVTVHLGAFQTTLKRLLAEATHSYALTVQTWLLTDREGPASLALESEDGAVAEVAADVRAKIDSFPPVRFRAHALWRALEAFREHLGTTDAEVRLFHCEERHLHISACAVRCLVDHV
jgi:hypothetical protein